MPRMPSEAVHSQPEVPVATAIAVVEPCLASANADQPSQHAISSASPPLVLEGNETTPPQKSFALVLADGEFVKAFKKGLVAQGNPQTPATFFVSTSGLHTSLSSLTTSKAACTFHQAPRSFPRLIALQTLRARHDICEARLEESDTDAKA